MPGFIYRCPNVGLQVQGWTAEETSGEQEFETVLCTACRQIHLVSPATGKVLGADQDPA
jgi:hypothetical protein